MVDIAHKNLTGADLHEPKGVATATAGKVYVTNGSGSGVFTPTSSFPGCFGNALYHIRDERSSGTNGDVVSLSTWNTRVLNTEVHDDLAITPSGNQLTLVAGSYYIECEAVTNFFGQNNGVTTPCVTKLRLRNITDGSTLVNGLSIKLNVGGNSSVNVMDENIVSQMRGAFTIPGTKIVAVQNWVAADLFNSPSYRGGRAVSSGENEIYLDLRLWKTA